MDTDVLVVLVKKEAPEEWSADVDQQDPEHLHIKEEQEELWTSLEGEHLHLKEETDVARFPLTAVSIKSEDDEEKHLFSQLHQQQIEGIDVPTSSSAGQMTAETGGGAETSRNPEKTSNSSEADVSNDDVNLDSELSDPWPETGDGDMNWNETRSSESAVKTVNKTFSCSECGEQFLHKWSLQKHLRVTNHSAMMSSGFLVNKKCAGVKKHVDLCRKVQTEVKSFSCEDCGKRFNKKSYLNTHMSVHTGQKPFACEICGKKFGRKTYLSSHMSVHTGQKPFACEFCGKELSRKEHLNGHMRVHTGQKPFACEICGQSFSHKKYLNSHRRVHTGQKPFTCEICGQSFSQKSNLNSHIRVHTGQKSFACQFCEQRFSRKEHLNCHIKVHTGPKP